MANHPSAEKRHRQTIKRRIRNRNVRGRMRTAIKATYSALSEGDTTEAKKRAVEARRLIDRAYSKGVLKRNTASRLISKLSRHVGD
jgi:small subunit ribosomal protein S20